MSEHLHHFYRALHDLRCIGQDQIQKLFLDVFDLATTAEDVQSLHGEIPAQFQQHIAGKLYYIENPEGASKEHLAKLPPLPKRPSPKLEPSPAPPPQSRVPPPSHAPPPPQSRVPPPSHVVPPSRVVPPSHVVAPPPHVVAPPSRVPPPSHMVAPPSHVVAPPSHVVPPSRVPPPPVSRTESEVSGSSRGFKKNERPARGVSVTTDTRAETGTRDTADLHSGEQRGRLEKASSGAAGSSHESWRTRDSRLETRDSRLETRDSRLETRDSHLETRDSRAETRDFRAETRTEGFGVSAPRQRIEDPVLWLDRNSDILPAVGRSVVGSSVVSSERPASDVIVNRAGLVPPQKRRHEERSRLSKAPLSEEEEYPSIDAARRRQPSARPRREWRRDPSSDEDWGPPGDGVSRTGDGVSRTGDGVSRTGDGVSRTGDGVSRTGDGVSRTGDGVPRRHITLREVSPSSLSELSELNHEGGRPGLKGEDTPPGYPVPLVKQSPRVNITAIQSWGSWAVAEDARSLQGKSVLLDAEAGADLEVLSVDGEGYWWLARNLRTARTGWFPAACCVASRAEFEDIVEDFLHRPKS